MTWRREPSTCPNRADHTPSPETYFEWHDWAELMIRTHDQVRCDGCGLFAIWVPRPAGALAPCGDCGGDGKVDVAAVPAGKELICAECVPVREAKREAGRTARIAQRWAGAT